MDAQPCLGLVLNAPEFFADPAFLRWLESDRLKFTWHRPGNVGEWPDVVVLVDPGLGGEGSDSDMPGPIWSHIVEACRAHIGAARDPRCHYMVRLTNLAT
jgi:hypothetical protein